MTCSPGQNYCAAPMHERCAFADARPCLRHPDHWPDPLPLSPFTRRAFAADRAYRALLDMGAELTWRRRYDTGQVHGPRALGSLCLAEARTVERSLAIDERHSFFRSWWEARKITDRELRAGHARHVAHMLAELDCEGMAS